MKVRCTTCDCSGTLIKLRPDQTNTLYVIYNENINILRATNLNARFESASFGSKQHVLEVELDIIFNTWHGC